MHTPYNNSWFMPLDSLFEVGVRICGFFFFFLAGGQSSSTRLLHNTSSVSLCCT
eukprot:NODE_728_length_1390_cov_16.371365_g536_i0.p7 GENE.NODE_728_length_1390_cov_16.371365_g536_i0~~NODE_728_length_1390_cov_16.371365_g536_i0.p7  ORF type:complete len:54 (-),score=11.68 NODE_728_length_1390_cov_16.371365_g536_i0:171-332(-)